MQSMPWLYNEDQLDRPVSQQSVRGRSQWLAILNYTVSNHYLATTSEQTEDFMCAVVVII
jgi:hypothetical protein